MHFSTLHAILLNSIASRLLMRSSASLWTRSICCMPLLLAPSAPRSAAHPQVGKHTLTSSFLANLFFFSWQVRWLFCDFLCFW